MSWLQDKLSFRRHKSGDEKINRGNNIFKSIGKSVNPWLFVFCPKHQQGGIWQASFQKTEEVNIPEGIEKPCSLQEDDKPNDKVSKNRCLMSQMDYSLYCQLTHT
ncbi:hypothetical protein AAY473_038143, partial [Plecturocebus cupreus]